MTATDATYVNGVLLTPVLAPVATVEDERATPSAVLRRALVAVDSLASVTGWALGFALSGGLRTGVAQPHLAAVSVSVLLAAATITAMASQRLYLARMCTIRAVEIARLGRSITIATVVALLLPRALPVDVTAIGAVSGGVLAFGLLLVARGSYRYWVAVRRRDGRFVRPVVVVGDNDEAGDLVRLIKDHPELGYRVIGFVGDNDSLPGDTNVPRLARTDGLLGALAASGTRGVIVATTALSAKARNATVRTLLQHGIHVQLTSGLWGIDHRRLLAQPLAHEPLFYLEPLRLARWQLGLKRVIDFVGAVVGGLLIALPIVVVAAVAVKLQDRGPVFYKQRRVGRHGREFTIWKLRTMIPDAELLYDELAETRAGRDWPLVKLADDPRRTRVGRLLERTSIDELPQLWNVIKGEMSLVGPRPATAVEVAGFDDELLLRQEVLPGITGLWQVEARDNPNFSAYRRYDLFYIENWSVSLDMAILVATLQRVLLRGLELVVSRRAELGGSVVPVGANAD